MVGTTGQYSGEGEQARFGGTARERGAVAARRAPAASNDTTTYDRCDEEHGGDEKQDGVDDRHCLNPGDERIEEKGEGGAEALPHAEVRGEGLQHDIV